MLLVLQVRGGGLEAVWADDPKSELDVILVDWDNAQQGDHPAQRMTINCTDDIDPESLAAVKDLLWREVRDV